MIDADVLIATLRGNVYRKVCLRMDIRRMAIVRGRQGKTTVKRIANNIRLLRVNVISLNPNSRRKLMNEPGLVDSSMFLYLEIRAPRGCGSCFNVFQK